uniref:Major facilitator superfamily (MFS) profile domain-containing protein n=1 Tax=Salix viminalis TaxID=40686 RepID=A0A6N2KPS4_SALVM
METVADDQKQTTQEVTGKKGGLRTMPFIIANETFEKVAGVGLHANMILYLRNEYNLSSASGAYILSLWGAISNFMPVLGALLSDSYLGRFRVIASATLISLLGITVLWLTAFIPNARPPHCALTKENMQACVSPNRGQLFLLFSSFALLSMGAGGIRPCSLAFAADQIDDPENPENQKTLQTFFNWYYASVGISVMFSVLAIVAIQDVAGWVVGFGVPVGFMLSSTIFFFLGSSRYIKVKANKSLVTGFVQVIVATWKNRNLALPPMDSAAWYHHKGSKLVAPTKKLGFLNKACVIRNPEKDLDCDGLAKDPWRLCTIKQVEEQKGLIRVIPIWSTGIVIAATLNQHALPVLQASTMDRHLVGILRIPAGSYGVFGLLTLFLWVAIYDRKLVPLLAKLTGRPRGLSNEQRMGIGILISCIATATAGVVENKRRATALRQGLADHPRAVVDMSANWLLPQHCLVGLAEALSTIGQIDFFYSQFPKSMKSIAMALLALSAAAGDLVASLIIGIVNDVTKRGGRVSWLSNNLNKGHYDYYYWLLSLLNVANFFYYLLCSRAFGNEDEKEYDGGEAMEEVEMHPCLGSPIRRVGV